MKKEKNTKQRLFEVMGRVDPSFKKRKLNEITEEETYKLKNEMVQYLKDRYKNLLDDGEGMDFDIEAAIWWYAYDHHDGMWSPLYSILSTSEYKPGRMEKSVDDAGEIPRMFYDDLVDKFGE